MWTLLNYESPEPLILSVGEEEEISIAQGVEAIVKAMDFQGEVQWDKTKVVYRFRT